MTTTGEGRAYGHNLFLSPNSTYTLTITLVGLAVGSVGNWVATVVKHDYDAPAATLVTPAVAVNSGTNTVTITFSATNLTALLSTGSGKFSGSWMLRNTSTPLEPIGGKLVVDRNGVASGTDSSPTITVGSSGSVTYSVTSTLPYSTLFKSLAKSLEELIVGTITRDSNGAATSASVEWPDGTTGTYTATTVSTLFPGAVDAYTVTYAGSTTVTYTQSALTRDTNGSVIYRPAMTIS